MPIPSQPSQKNQSFNGDAFKLSKPLLWLLIGAIGLFVVIIVAVFSGGEGGEKTDEAIKAEILRSLSAPSDAPQISAEEKKQILDSLSAPSDAPQISAEEKARILESLSAPSQ